MMPQHLNVTQFFLDGALMLSVIFGALAVAMMCLGVWNWYFVRFVSEAEASRGGGSFLRALRQVILTRMNGFNEQQFSRRRIQQLAELLVVAGDPSDLKPGEFIGLQELSCVGATFFALVLLFGLNLHWYWVPGFSVVGWILPNLWLRDRIAKRHHAIIRALPYNLDLLTLAVEAGLDFAQAVGKVVEKGRQGPLADELRLVLRNIKLGKTREESLRSMAERVQLPALSSFTSALIQADRMGTSLGKILRIQATQLRIERTNRAEKLANEAPVKMLFPLIFFIFPTIFGVIFGPLIYQFIFTVQ
jgi:tight adherence protein C